MATTDIVGTRHPRKTLQVPTAIAQGLNAERLAARGACDAGVHTGAWRLLERTHLLSQLGRGRTSGRTSTCSGSASAPATAGPRRPRRTPGCILVEEPAPPPRPPESNPQR